MCLSFKLFSILILLFLFQLVLQNYTAGHMIFFMIFPVWLFFFSTRLSLGFSVALGLFFGILLDSLSLLPFGVYSASLLTCILVINLFSPHTHITRLFPQAILTTLALGLFNILFAMFIYVLNNEFLAKSLLVQFLWQEGSLGITLLLYEVKKRRTIW